MARHAVDIRYLPTATPERLSDVGGRAALSRGYYSDLLPLRSSRSPLHIPIPTIPLISLVQKASYPAVPNTRPPGGERRDIYRLTYRVAEQLHCK